MTGPWPATRREGQLQTPSKIPPLTLTLSHRRNGERGLGCVWYCLYPPTDVILGLVPRTHGLTSPEAIWLGAAARQTHPTNAHACQWLDPRTKSEDDTELKAPPRRSHCHPGARPRDLWSRESGSFRCDRAAPRAPTIVELCGAMGPGNKCRDDTKLEARPCSHCHPGQARAEVIVERAAAIPARDPGPRVPAAANPSSQQNYGAAACCRFTSSRTATCNLESRARVAASACL